MKVEMLKGKYWVVLGDYVISGPYDTEDEARECIDVIIDSFEDENAVLASMDYTMMNRVEEATEDLRGEYHED